jgi:phosphatidate cytidylyltransferase
MTGAPSAPPSPPGRPGPGRGDLPARLLTAAVGIPIVLALIVAGGPPYVAAVALLLALGALELARAAGVGARDPLAWLGAAGAGAMAPAVLGHPDLRLGVFAALVAGTLTLAVLRAEVVDGFRRWASVVAGAVYTGVLGGHLVLLRDLDDGRAWVLFMLFATFAADTGAFFVGRALGGPRLAPRISPGKTVSGAVGGLVCGAAAGVALAAVLGLDLPPATSVALGTVVALAAGLGDLAESLLKRSLGVKDTGRLFPGHGGVLDRMDSVLFTAPVVYYVVQWTVL